MKESFFGSQNLLSRPEGFPSHGQCMETSMKIPLPISRSGSHLTYEGDSVPAIEENTEKKWLFPPKRQPNPVLYFPRSFIGLHWRTKACRIPDIKRNASLLRSLLHQSQFILCSPVPGSFPLELFLSLKMLLSPIRLLPFLSWRFGFLFMHF